MVEIRLISNQRRATVENARRWLDISRRWRRCEQGAATDLHYAPQFAATSLTKAEWALIPCWRPMGWTMCWTFWTKAKHCLISINFFISKGPASRAGPNEMKKLTFALLGGGVWTPPLRFFADSKKTAARSAAGFSPTLSPIFLATFVKVSILGHARSGHQVRSSDHTLQKVYNRAPATVFEGKLWNFRNMIRSSVPTKCISWIFDIGDLRSGHFRDLPIISQWAKMKLPVLCFILSLYEWIRIR